MVPYLPSYDTITLRPRYSTLTSRAFANTTMDFLGKKFRLPVVPSNMSDVIDVNIAKKLSENGYFYVMHRFDGFTPSLIRQANQENWQTISVSVGVTPEQLKNPLREIMIGQWPRLDFVTVDVAHGHHGLMKEAVLWLKHHVPMAKIIAGNVATAEGALFLAELGVDAIKVGIGGGGICTTRYKTGFHLPTLHSVGEIAIAFQEKNIDIPIIADGGAKHYGDIAKALTFGATMVMSGGWFASCIDSPAKIENGKKIYRGSTSYAAKGENKHVEGKTLELESGVTIDERLREIQQSLQSSISYAGGDDLSAFEHVEYERILPFH